MATANPSIVIRQHSRRSTRGLSLLPTTNLLEDVPSGMPADERLRVLLRRCFKRAVEEISEEVEPFRELHQEFLAEGQALFDDAGDDDRLTQLLKSATDLNPATKPTVEDVAKHHDQLRALTDECKRWKELMASDMSDLFPSEEDVEEAAAAQLPPDRKLYYEEVSRRADRARRAAFQYAAAIRAMAGMRDQDDAGKAEEDTSDEVDEASTFEDV